MTRKKVKLTFISNDSARKATFKKRKRGLIKKVSELSTLCGIEACAVIYSPYDSQPEIWPSENGVQRVLTQFKKMPEMEQSKKMVNQETFLRQRILKANEQLKKQRKDNREKEITQIMFQCLVGKLGLLGFNILDLNDLRWLIDQNLKDINKRIELLLKQNSHTTQSQPQLDQPQISLFAAPDHREADHHQQTNNFHIMAQKQENDDNDDNDNDNNNMLDCMQLQRQPWFMDLGYVGVGEDQMNTVLTFADHNHNNALWSNSFFP